MAEKISADGAKRTKKWPKTVGWAVSLVLGDYGKGLVNLALAESFLEKGRDNQEVTALVNRNDAGGSGGRIELVFDGVAMLVRSGAGGDSGGKPWSCSHNFHLRIEKNRAYRPLHQLALLAP